ncbi:uncharacterized protein LOC128728344 [Anopheles nili]|uniref:uncharacterized protein LOC128728344 n=1 Tax=Anopheles nili TaxID=185578 RepID=UPI00237B4344|nr:uncharacterized protein LOC128728344 [Anopheles nili]
MAAFFNRNKIKNDLLLMILNSKRLFKEHLNVLEEYILDNYFDSLEKLVAEEELVSKGIMKKQFQPVLRQLRERLEPIERSFKLREKQALKMKGIEIPDEPEEDSEKKEPLGPETSDSEEEASAVATKKKLNQNRYNASRSFLANKEQINLFQNIPLETPMSESILE